MSQDAKERDDDDDNDDNDDKEEEEEEEHRGNLLFNVTFLFLDSRPISFCFFR